LLGEHVEGIVVAANSPVDAVVSLDLDITRDQGRRPG
jgi:hypothetical protein